jgi:membrane protease YdiL (CAAX protease family)
VAIGFLINTIGSGVAIYSLAVAYGASTKEILSGAALQKVPPAALFAVLLGASFVWPAVALVASRLGQVSFQRAFRWHGIGLLKAALAVVLGAAIVPVALTLEHAMSRMAPRGENLLMQMMAQDPGTLGLVLLGATLVVAAPVGEELLFRGLSLQGLERRYGFWPAAFIVSTIFASIHLNLTGLPALFLVSLVLCWVTSRLGSLLPAILMHASYNGVQFSMLAVSDPSPESVKQALSSPAWPMPAWLVLLSIALAAGCLLVFARRGRRGASASGEAAGQATSGPGESQHSSDDKPRSPKG